MPKQGFGEHIERMMRLHRRILKGPLFTVAVYADAEGVSARQIHPVGSWEIGN